MSYDIEQGTTRFHIAADRTADAFRLARTLLSPDSMADAEGGVICGGLVEHQWYAFVDPQELEDAADLAGFLAAFRWRPTIARDGDIAGVEFMGSGADQSDLLFESIAPAVTAGSFIEMTGEDGAVWRWVFDGSTCTVDVQVGSTCGPGWLREPVKQEEADLSEDPPTGAADPEGWRA
jgi:hypothetical protein